MAHETIVEATVKLKIPHRIENTSCLSKYISSCYGSKLQVSSAKIVSSKTYKSKYDKERKKRYVKYLQDCNETFISIFKNFNCTDIKYKKLSAIGRIGSNFVLLKKLSRYSDNILVQINDSIPHEFSGTTPHTSGCLIESRNGIPYINLASDLARQKIGNWPQSNIPPKAPSDANYRSSLSINLDTAEYLFKTKNGCIKYNKKFNYANFHPELKSLKNGYATSDIRDPESKLIVLLWRNILLDVETGNLFNRSFEYCYDDYGNETLKMCGRKCKPVATLSMKTVAKIVKIAVKEERK